MTPRVRPQAWHSLYRTSLHRICKAVAVRNPTFAQRKTRPERGARARRVRREPARIACRAPRPASCLSCSTGLWLASGTHLGAQGRPERRTNQSCHFYAEIIIRASDRNTNNGHPFGLLGGNTKDGPHVRNLDQKVAANDQTQACEIKRPKPLHSSALVLQRECDLVRCLGGKSAGHAAARLGTALRSHPPESGGHRALAPESGR